MSMYATAVAITGALLLLLVYVSAGLIPALVALSMLATIMLTVAGIHIFAANVGRILLLLSRRP